MIIKKHKTKFIAAFVILGLLTGAWLLGDSPVADNNIPIFDNAIDTPIVLAATEPIAKYDYFDEVYETENEQLLTEELLESDELYKSSEETEEPTSDEVIEPITVEEILVEVPLTQSYQSNESIISYEPSVEIEIEAQTIPYIAPIVDEPESLEIEPDEPIIEDIQIFEENTLVMPEPIEPEDMVITDESFTVTLSVRVDTLLNNMHLLHRDKHELVPLDGVIFPATQVTVYQGESVFNILQREMRRERIHMVSRFTPGFNSAYIEAINNIYEFDAGPLSGWMYSVNGWFPNFGASRYLLSPGDVIEWHYTVDLGRDLGTYWLRGYGDE